MRPYRRKRVLLPVGVLLAMSTTAAAFFIWYHHSPAEDIRDAADESQVNVPESAIQVFAHFDRIRIQGGCSQLSFLLPTSQWRTYVGEYIKEPLVATSYGPTSTCEDIPNDCVKKVSAGAIIGYTSMGQIDAEDVATGSRYLYVAPDCEAGRTLLSWNTFDL